MVAYENIKIRLASIALVQATGLVTTFAFVFFLPDDDLTLVVGVMALAGLISSTAVSNNTAKVYATINAKNDVRRLTNLTLLLFAFEQWLALSLASLFWLFGSQWIVGLGGLELVLLAMAACSGALNAFVKCDARMFVLFNVVRSITTLLRLALVFLALWGQVPELVPAVIIASFAVPLLFGLGVTWRTRAGAVKPIEPQPLVAMRLLREYAWGIPVALSRAFVNQGLILAAVELLRPDELRMFRFLLMLKEGIGKQFNALLPLLFDRMYGYRLKLLPSVGFAAAALTVAVAWYAIGDYVFGFGFSALGEFAIFQMLNMTVYSVLPITWRTIFRDKAVYITAVVIASCGVAYAVFWVIAPKSVDQIFIAWSAFLLCYILGMLVVARQENYQRAND